MPILSKLRTTASAGARFAQVLVQSGQKTRIPVRNMGGHKMVKRPSSFQKYQFLDDLYYFLALGGVPMVLLITYTNITIGPAQLVDTPEDYVPESHEYYRLPITRFLAKYLFDSYEKIHERTLYYLHKADEKRRNKLKQVQVKSLQREKPDHKGWYYIPANGNLQERITQYESPEVQGSKDVRN